MAAMALWVVCRALTRNSFRSQSYLNHFQVTSTCYKYISNLTSIVQNLILSWCYSVSSFAFNGIILLPFILVPCSLPFEANGRSPIDFVEQWTRSAKLQLTGQFPLSFMVSFSKGSILAAGYLSIRRCTFSKARHFKWEQASSGERQQAEENDSWSSIQKVSLTALLHPSKELRTTEILFRNCFVQQG